jgi:hypothetical protein
LWIGITSGLRGLTLNNVATPIINLQSTISNRADPPATAGGTDLARTASITQPSIAELGIIAESSMLMPLKPGVNEIFKPTHASPGN